MDALFRKISLLAGHGDKAVTVRTVTGESHLVCRELDSPLEQMLALSVYPETADGKEFSEEDVGKFDVVLIPMSNVTEIRAMHKLPSPGGSITFKAD